MWTRALIDRSTTGAPHLFENTFQMKALFFHGVSEHSLTSANDHTITWLMRASETDQTSVRLSTRFGLDPNSEVLNPLNSTLNLRTNTKTHNFVLYSNKSDYINVKIPK